MDDSNVSAFKGSSFMALLVYLDNIVIASNDPSLVFALKSFLDSKFKLKDLGNLKYFLGLEVAGSSTGISLCQCKYALELLSDSGLLAIKPVQSPMDQNCKLSNVDIANLLVDHSSYRRLIGRLIYLTITRPNIFYAVNTLVSS
ncbi:uncharacterized mitochondrial protein AtMg00810-like [Carya illinoinensis]|uniref:uncharacterized mitochondrial protein AtMg00810-like n=1 Tax=Carya illinoinensis TaxID=32201 RepID=UPI001C72154F|nr:uncharacterized mitochondrial protein AtMg00810-like [Carya illinoinensis]